MAEFIINLKCYIQNRKGIAQTQAPGDLEVK